MKYWHPHLLFGQHISVSTLVTLKNILEDIFFLACWKLFKAKLRYTSSHCVRTHSRIKPTWDYKRCICCISTKHTALLKEQEQGLVDTESGSCVRVKKCLTTMLFLNKKTNGIEQWHFKTLEFEFLLWAISWKTLITSWCQCQERESSCMQSSGKK